MYIYASIFESHVVRGERLVPAERRCLVQLRALRSAAPDSAAPVADVRKALVDTPIAPAGAPGTLCTMQRTPGSRCIVALPFYCTRCHGNHSARPDPSLLQSTSAPCHRPFLFRLDGGCQSCIFPLQVARIENHSVFHVAK